MYFGTYHPTLSPKLQNSLLHTYNNNFSLVLSENISPDYSNSHKAFRTHTLKGAVAITIYNRSTTPHFYNDSEIF